MVHTRWWGRAFVKHEAQSGWAKKPKTELQWLGFGLQWGCKRWRGVLWGYSPPSCAKMERGDEG